MPEVTFRSRDAARSVRTDASIRPFLAESDDARTATVQFRPETPETVLNDVTAQAADSRRAEAEKVGQAPLTDTERDRIDFTKTNVPAARSVKAKAQEQNVDFLAVFDPELTVDENRALVEREAGGRQASRRPDQLAREQATGGPFGGPSATSASEIDKSLAGAFATVDAEETERAKRFAFEDADPGARDFLTEQGRPSEVFDISFSRADTGGLIGSGTDFDRLLDRHESRSQRAQSLDERKSAAVTRDPFEWLDNPAQVDFPGIDTVDPAKLHSERSDHARAVDERERAPLAETKEEWALAPDQTDWPGVDTPSFGRDPGGSGGEEALLDTSGLGEQQGLGGGVAERDAQASFDLGSDTSPDTRFAAEEASEFGVDDRSEVGRGVDTSMPDLDDAGLEAFGGGVQENKRLDDLM